MESRVGTYVKGNMEKNHPLNSVPRFENHYASRQRSLYLILASASIVITLFCAMYHLFILGSRSGAYAIAMMAWLPLFIVGITPLIYANKIQDTADTLGSDAARNLAHRAFTSSVAITMIMMSIIVTFSIWIAF